MFIITALVINTSAIKVGHKIVLMIEIKILTSSTFIYTHNSSSGRLTPGLTKLTTILNKLPISHQYSIQFDK